LEKRWYDTIDDITPEFLEDIGHFSTKKSALKYKLNEELNYPGEEYNVFEVTYEIKKEK